MAKAKKTNKSQSKKTIKSKKTSAVKSTKKASAKKTISKKASPAKPPRTMKAVVDSGVRRPSAITRISLNFSPLDDRLVVLQDGKVDRTPGGLFIPDSVEDRPLQGQVIAIGRGHLDKKGRLQPMGVKVGDQVLFDKFAGQKLMVKDQEVLVLRESEILGILDNLKR